MLGAFALSGLLNTNPCSPAGVCVFWARRGGHRGARNAVTTAPSFSAVAEWEAGAVLWERGMRKRRVGVGCVAGVVGFALLLVTAPRAVRAEDSQPPHPCPICSKTADETASYSSNATHTLARGAINILFGWTEMLRQPAEEVKSGGNLLSGIGKGVGQSLQRTASGAGELLTFWTPKGRRGYVHFANDCPLCMKSAKPPQDGRHSATDQRDSPVERAVAR